MTIYLNDDEYSQKKNLWYLAHVYGQYQIEFEGKERTFEIQPAIVLHCPKGTNILNKAQVTRVDAFETGIPTMERKPGDFKIRNDKFYFKNFILRYSGKMKLLPPLSDFWKQFEHLPPLHRPNIHIKGRTYDTQIEIENGEIVSVKKERIWEI